MAEEIHCSVIDNGGGYMKVGVSGEDFPRYVFPTVVNSPDTKNCTLLSPLSEIETQDSFGYEAFSKRGIGNMRYPIEHGIIVNFDSMEKIWKHSFEDRLSLHPKGTNVLMTECEFTPKANRERQTQILFEDFNIENYYVSKTSVLSLYASGRTTGVVVDSGDGITHTVPIYEGYALPHASYSSSIAGRSLDDYIARKLRNRKVGTDSYLSWETAMLVAKDIKEKHCRVSLDYEKEIKTIEPISFKLPDGKIFKLKDEIIKCPEIMFSLSKEVGVEDEGIANKLSRTIRCCDHDLKADFMSNIVLAGGNTCFSNFKKRLERDVDENFGRAWKSKITAPESREISGWIGGSILSSLSTFQEMWMTKQEYDESGPAMVHRKCF